MAEVEAEVRPLFRARTSVLLLAVLVVPFAISLSTTTEPFPAMIFPGGTGTVRTENSVAEFAAQVIVAFDESGAPVQVDTGEFLEPIPVHYFYALDGAGFGLGERDLEVAVKKLGWVLTVPRPEATEEERREVRTWLGDRLESLGYDREKFIIRHLWVTVDADTGRELSRETTSETVYDL